ncbi:glycosyltransferase family 2 protein [Seonamhaeicola aphaedonensis]|uniref:Glycosyltransferase involved in cell wall biosynthesis n=1 Tax=Seonamhaeicola aphaedonensis TaxID=1461338 RepID=A0A3D9HFV5_9FLAO|nr:glycosyltransferase family 2 protein [Seonamhaeicola aphaedonensis]RED48363.1 glycosyltransferase involved in cell wall biosynthesis [Seonamhaeicola aphaedonensis]
MIQNNLISIIIPTYNRAKLLGATIESVINQTYTNWECIVVDDGSTDDTEKLVKSYSLNDSRIKYFLRPKSYPKGASSCRNYGYKMSKGQYINWLDSDDLIHEDKLKYQVKCLNDNEKLDFVVSQTYFFKDEIKKNDTVWNQKLISKLPYKDFIMNKIGWSTNAPLWRESFLKGKELFNINLKSSQDWEFHAKMLLFKPIYEIVKGKMVFVRLENKDRIGNSININRRYNRYQSSKLVYKKLEEKGFLDEELKEYFFNYQFENYTKFLRNYEPICKEIKTELHKIDSRILNYTKVELTRVIYYFLFQLRLIKRFFKIKF